MVSFVVIAYNEERAIGQVLDSILAQEGAKDHEIIVVDDGSTDRTATVVSMLAHRHDAIRLIRNETNRGRGFARSVGVRSARGAYLAMVDADIALPPDWLHRCTVAIRGHDAVGGRAVPDGDVAYLYRRFGLTPRARPHTTVVTGSNALYRREIFERVSFDSRLRDGEDVALNHALRQAQARVQSIADLTVCHLEDKNLRASLVWLYQSGRGATRQFLRYGEVRPPDLAFAGCIPVTAAAAALARRRPGMSTLPLAYLVAVALAHVARAFHWDRQRPLAFAGAVVIDMGLLAAYFAGRITGLWRTWRRSSPVGDA
jgi:glycosyltransferase involved in cell wall biosynthesis